VFHAGGLEFTVGCVGTVCVHPDDRGKGYMKELMRRAIEDMQTQGFAYSVLWGLRQRYEYFGYALAGVQIEFTLIKDNIRHKYGTVDSSQISFAALEENQTELLEKAYALYEKSPCGGVRPKEKFLKILGSHNGKPCAVFSDGIFAGYLSHSDNKSVLLELKLEDISLLPAVCKAWFTQNGLPDIRISLPVYETAWVQELTGVCESCVLKHNHNYLIFDYTKTVQAFCNVKASYARMVDGRFVLNINGRKKIEITVTGGKPFVRRCERDDVPADLSLNSLQATMLLFSPMGKYNLPGGEQSLPVCVNNWLPLPLFSPEVDIC